MFYYKRLENKAIVSVEEKSVDIPSPGFRKATKEEVDGFIASLPIPEPIPSRDLEAEIDELREWAKTKGFKEAKPILFPR